MDRKEFLKQAASVTILLSTSSIFNVYAQGIPILKSGDLSEFDLERVSEALQKKVDRLINFLREKGWLKYIFDLGLLTSDKLDISELISGIPPEKLSKIKELKGFEDFGGNRFIEPGYPALSLLYHILANPRVRPNEIELKNYPELYQLDTLEDYIYALKNWDSYKTDYRVATDDELVLAVFAYEYRTAFKTPHHQCADLVFSRTGVGRIGEKEIRYDKLNRCFTNNPTGNDDDKNISVIPARYGVFIAKKAKIKDNLFEAMKMQKERHDNKRADIHYIKNNNDYDYLIPVRKLFNDDLLIDSAKINFGQKHESLKIANLFKPVKPELIRNSDSLVSTTVVNSSYLIISKRDKLIKPVIDPGSKKILVYDGKYKRKDLYFTSLYNGNKSSVVEDIEVYNSANNERSLNTYDNPRNLPMYVNISHELEKDTIYYRSRNADFAFEKEIENNKQHNIPLFEDNICDGYVSANIEGLNPENKLKLVFGRGVLNAFSIITAPDFFPQVDGFDLQQFDIAPGLGDRSLFFEGGVASLATCNIPPNPIVYQNTKSELLGVIPKETFSSVISNTPKSKGLNIFSNPEREKGYIFSSYLPDICSSVFAPGWDVTYSNSKNNQQIFLSTQGLGSPFVEDMKLCAAMNGMWPAASPDASRTFQGSVTEEELHNKKKEWLRNPTAIPLMDSEIGIHENSPACKDHDQKPTLGWDGEQGPYLDFYKNNWWINFTDLGRADYVENALQGSFDMSKLRNLTSKELNFRMKCLRICLESINAKNYPNGETDLWLVSAEKVKWNESVSGFGIPKTLLDTKSNEWATKPQSGMDGDGYLFVFAGYKPDKNLKSKLWVNNGDHTKRRWVKCETVYLCQVCEGRAKYYFITLNDNNHYEPAKWSKLFSGL